MAASTLRISRQRKELISQYATAAVFLYGIISIDEFVEVFNHYEETRTTSEEALLAMTRLAKTDDVEYSISNNIISGPDFQPEFEDYEDNVMAIRDAQKGKPRYLPTLQLQYF
jgi:antirestriction protein